MSRLVPDDGTQRAGLSLSLDALEYGLRQELRATQPPEARALGAAR